MIGDKKLIALCTSRIFDPQIQSFIEILNEELKLENAWLWIYAINADIYWSEDELPAEAHVFDHIQYDRVDVVVIMDEKIKSHEVSNGIISHASAHDIPVIVVDGEYEGCVSISYDYASGFESVVRHVIEHHGVKRPHFMAGIKGNKFSEERQEVFKKVLEENGIAFSDDMVSYGEFWAIPAREATRQIIARGELPEAIICANDIMAINACDVLKEAGYTVPDDVIVTGFDGYDEAFMGVPGLTTAGCMTPGLADTVYSAISNCLNGEHRVSYQAKPILIANESCGCPRVTIQDTTVMKNFNNSFYRYQDDIRAYHGIVVDMMSSTSYDQMMRCLHSWFTKNMCCIVNADCFKGDRNFFLEEEHSDEYRILYDSERYSDYPDPFDPADIVPGFEKRMESGYPLIFNSLDYMNKPFGYVCYMFGSYDITEYAKTSSLTDTVNSGLGGYINMQYSRFMLGKVEEMYKTDALTGLYNRLAAHEAFEALRNDPDKQGKPLCVIMADLNKLKQINDTLGHSAGDKAIAAVASSLKESCPEGSICVRFGGDEMLAFIIGEHDTEAILANARQILERRSAECGFDISASCGTYETFVSSDMDIDGIIRKADEQMYLNKARK